MNFHHFQNFLVWEGLGIAPRILVDTVDGADLDARLVDTIPTEPRDHPRHRIFCPFRLVQRGRAV